MTTIIRRTSKERKEIKENRVISYIDICLEIDRLKRVLKSTNALWIERETIESLRYYRKLKKYLLFKAAI